MKRTICLGATLVVMGVASAMLGGCARSIYLGTGYSSYSTYGYGHGGSTVCTTTPTYNALRYGTFTPPYHHHGHHSYKYSGHHGHHHGGYDGGGYCDD